MIKLKGMAPHDVNTVSKEGTLSYFQFCQLLIEHYSNIPYALDALNTYAHILQGEHELIAEYLTRAKVLLECIHHNSKMCDILGFGHDKLYLVKGLYPPHAWGRIVSKQDTWHLIEDVFQTTEHITMSKEWNRAFFNLEALKPVIQVNEVIYSKAMQQYKSDPTNNGQPCPVQFHNTFRENNKQPRGLFRKSPGQQAYKHTPKKIVCYYCEGEHLIKECVKLAKEYSWEKQKDTEVARLYKNKLQDTVQRGNITINEASFARALRTAYSMAQTEQLLGNLQLDESDVLDRFPYQ